MNLINELEQIMLAVVDGKASLANLHDFLADHAQELANNQNERWGALINRAWVLLSEFDLGHRNEPSVRDELGALLPMRTLHWVDEPAASVVQTGSGSAIVHRGIITWPQPSWSARISREAVFA